MTEIDVLIAAINKDLGEPSSWGKPVEFPDSLALCALNSAFSLRGSTAATINVLNRYRAFRTTANTDGGPDLLEAMDMTGGSEDFAREVLDNRSKLPGTNRLRTVGIYEGLTRLAALGNPITATGHLRAAVRSEDGSAQKAWLSVKGFGPLAWSYLIMNAGIGSETKPDVMVKRFLTRALNDGTTLNNERIQELLRVTAKELDVEPRSLDRAIWLHESPSTK